MRRCRWTFGLALIAIVWLTTWPLRAAVDPLVYEELAVEYVEGAAQAVAASTPRDCTPEGGCECIADWVDLFTQSNKYRGNAYRMQFDSKLAEFKVGLAFEGRADLYFSIHVQNLDDAEYKPVWVGSAVSAEGDGTPQFYSSGLFDGGANQVIDLDAGRLYALAVSWEDKQITHARDLATTYPVEFDSYTVLGHVTDGVPAGGLPLPEDQNISPIITRVHAFSMEVCLDPEPGACCGLDAGVPGCSEILENACVSQGSWFHGERSTCNEVSCDFGVCCSPCSSCTIDYTPEACEVEEGVAHWLGLDCSTSPELLCPVVTGACCTGTTCEELCIDDCEGIGGVYNGHGTTCDPNICSGACCVTGGCVNLTDADCLTFQGTFKGAGTTCETLSSDNECGGACCRGFFGLDDCVEVPSRSACTTQFPEMAYLGDGVTCTACGELADYIGCCLPDGTCINTTADFCSARWVQGFMALSACPATCTTRACCYDNGDCEVITAVACNARGGAWKPANTTCEVGTCDLPTGECCLCGGTCASNMTEPECVDAGGIYQGDSVAGDCSTVSCDEVGVCCLDDGSCLDSLSLDECETAFGGVYQGPNCTDCGSAVCEDMRGACCTQSGECLYVLEEQCLAIGESTFLGAGERCSGSSTCPSGACCLEDGSCVIRYVDDPVNPTVDKCGAANGTYQGAGTVCELGRCDLGACCTDDGIGGFTCDDEHIESDCSGVDDVWAGKDKTCAGGACVTGGCCKLDGSCTDGEIEVTCTAEVGATFAGATTECDLNADCPAPAACCLLNEACETFTEAFCLTLPDAIFAGVGVVCGPADVCKRGACCHTDGTCDDADALPSDCTEPLDLFYPRDTCNTIDTPCESRGACCLDGTCTIEADIDCTILGGTYLGEGSLCDEQLCAVGACCSLVGSCLDGVVRVNCDEAGGETFHAEVACEAIAAVCVARGACCPDGGGACTIATQVDCEAAAGSYAGDGVPCDVGLCAQPGACCDAGVCSVVMETECLGDYQGDGVPCEVGTCPVGFAAASPAHDGSLWRSKKNISRLTFDADLPSTPITGEVKINELLPDGLFGSDLSAFFTFDVEGGTVLKVQDTADTLQHRTWYAIRNAGSWAGVLPFAVHYVVQMGDCDGNKLVISLDVGCVNAGIPCFIGCGDDNRKDMDGDGRIISLDVGVVNGNIGSFRVPKPTGH